MKRFTVMLLCLLCLFSFTCYADDGVYTVQDGDTLWKVAVKLKVGLKELMKLNPHIADPDVLRVGEKLIIPPRDEESDKLEMTLAKLINDFRVLNGVEPIHINWQLARLARIKAEDMNETAHYSRTSLTYGTTFDMMKLFKIPAQSAAENIAYGYMNADEVMKAWLQFDEEFQNILNPRYTDMGVGVARGKEFTWSVLFVEVDLQ